MEKGTGIRLERLTAEELAPYLDRLISGYAQGHVRDGQWTAAEAPERSRQEIRRLLPQGVDTPDHYLYAIRVGSQDVGRIWFARRQEAGGAPHAFVFDLFIDPEHRRHGYAEAAMRAIEPKIRELGLHRVALHVFGDNAGAIRLYERLGYSTTNLLMAKTVGAPPKPA